ncbi:hypothetical protein KIPB_001041 [Kipferlia bialata]|uniref:Uncharacterized protein n=1 Tax=Kipferlia bialata TaxID=797122 RepID=A0A9K3CN57_9EUKA|nr:hypothetical protein KIPB_001041 [Kipferlia bialata]|eukprot:g1041.t1
MSHVFCVPVTSTDIECVTLTLPTTYGEETMQASPAAISPSFLRGDECVTLTVGTRLYVTKKRSFGGGRLFAAHEMDTGDWKVMTWYKGATDPDPFIWAIGDCIYSLGLDKIMGQPGQAVFKKYDTGSRVWTALDLPEYVGRLMGTLQGPSSRLVTVVNDAAYVMITHVVDTRSSDPDLSEQSGIRGFFCYSPVSGWLDLTDTVRHTLLHSVKPRTFAHHSVAHVKQIHRALVCGQYIVYVRPTPSFPVYDTVSSEWTEWSALDMHGTQFTQAGDGRIFYAQTPTNQSTKQSFSLAEVEPSLIYPHPDVRWALKHKL